MTSNIVRVTVAHCNRRQLAEAERTREEREHPGCNALITGEPGAWKVRRDRLPDDPPAVPVRRRMAVL